MSHYETLGVPKNATSDDIKKAYRKLASQHHPDKGGDTATFQKIQAAYETLSDPGKKQEYDNPRPQGFPNMGGFSFHGDDLNISEIFGQMFGGQFRNHAQGNRNQIFRTQVQVTLEDAYKGTTTTLKVQTPVGTKVINVDIPKGVLEGSQLRYDNIIDNATLIIEFRIIPHLKFERRHSDLYSNYQISVLDLIAGTTFEFTTLSGKTLEVRVPEKTQPFMQLKLGGHGMPVPNSNAYGDQIILLKPYIPDKIDDEVMQSILRSKQK